MQLEVTPRGPPSRAITLDRPSRPCLAATYALLYGEARRPWTEEMLTTRPQPRSYMPGSTARARRNGVSTIRASMAANRSGGNSSTGATCWNPALLTSTSADSPSPSTPAGSVRSAATAVPPSSPATRSAPSPSRSTTVTLAPAPARRRAQASPMPLAPPVTMAVLPPRSTSIRCLHPEPSGCTRLPTFRGGDQLLQRQQGGCAMTSGDQTSERSSIRQVVAASFIGTSIEWYDFFLYGTAAALVFNKLFFPNIDPLLGTLAAFGTYGVGFFARPLGGLVFGHYGDKIGRKTMLVLSLLIMGLATFFIGLLPSYDSIGIWAAVGLVVLRLLQGFGVGGEWAGAVLMVAE